MTNVFNKNAELKIRLLKNDGLEYFQFYNKVQGCGGIYKVYCNKYEDLITACEEMLQITNPIIKQGFEKQFFQELETLDLIIEKNSKKEEK